MKTREIERALGAANPVGRGRLDGLDLEAMEADLLADLEAGFSTLLELEAARPRRYRQRGFVLALGSAALAVVLAAALVLTGGGSNHPSPAYGAVLVRFAESTPLLLLEGRDWRVQNVYEAGQGPYMPRSSRGAGSMEFVTGKPVPYESVRTTCAREVTSMSGKFPVCKAERESGMLPPAVRQRRVELRWFHGSLADSLSTAHKSLHPHGRSWIKLPVLDTTADVDTRAEFYVNQGGPGNRQMTALWSEGGYVLELRAAVPDLAAFEERLDWLTPVDSQTWLDAMPAKVVKAADHDAAVREMLKGIPVPSGFKPSRIPGEGLTTNRDQVAGSVTAIVSCLWFRQWGEARRSGDRAAAAEAEKAMATAKHWPILDEMAKEGAYPAETIWELAADMPSGKGRRGWRLLPQTEALGCARWGIPVLPRKQRLQRERREQS
ncbi:MAG TPA: hypothetical protein VN758_04015 [Solirubrobacterales bacterium]|nr:hypothetical protein [Solirubrobacterales bacterium]